MGHRKLCLGVINEELEKLIKNETTKYSTELFSNIVNFMRIVRNGNQCHRPTYRVPAGLYKLIEYMVDNCLDLLIRCTIYDDYVDENSQVISPKKQIRDKFKYWKEVVIVDNKVLQEAKKKFEEDMNKLQQQLKQCIKDRDEYKETAILYKNAVVVICTELQVEKNQFQTEIIEIKAENTQLRAALDAKDKEIEELKSENTFLKKWLSFYVQSYEKLEKTGSELKSNEEINKNEIEALMEKKNRMQMDMSELTKSEKLVKTLKMENEELECLAKYFKDLINECKDATEQNNELINCLQLINLSNEQELKIINDKSKRVQTTLSRIRDNKTAKGKLLRMLYLAKFALFGVSKYE